MTENQLRTYRKENRLTQLEAARRLGVSQTYLSLLESGKRHLNKRLERKAAKLFGLPPTGMPMGSSTSELSVVSDDQLASDLADLGYTGFSHLTRKRKRQKNPADVLLSALKAHKRDARLVEALPWLLLNFPDLKWNEVSKVAKAYDLQNRLGYVTNVARRVAERRGHNETAAKLWKQEAELQRSLLVREETLCNESMTQTERNWLAQNRPEEAKQWHLLTDLSPHHLSYAK